MQIVLDAFTFIAIYGVSYGVILFTISIGLVVTMSLMRVVNLAHGLFAAAGGYLTALLMNAWGTPFALAVAAAALAVTLAGFILERLIYSRIYQATELEQVLLTIGLMFVGIAGLNATFGPDTVGAHLPPMLEANIELLGRTVQAYRIAIVIFGAVLMVALWFLFDRTEFGARLRAAVDNRGMAEAIGIDVRRLFSITFAMGTGLAALGGGVGIGILSLEPTYPFRYLTLILIVVAMSGIGNIKELATVAIVLGVIDTGSRYFSPDWGGFVIYIVLIAFMLRSGQNAQPPAGAIVTPHGLLDRSRIRLAEIVYWAGALAVFFLFPSDLSFATLLAVTALFVLSLDLALGFGGVMTLGHAAFFGVGAYAAGLIALGGHQEPITGAILAGLVAALLACCIAPIVLRVSGLPQVMVTLVFGVMLFELANKLNWLTGGEDGLAGFTIDPLFGTFRWSIFGHTSYLYALGWLFLLFLLLRRAIASPFGVALQGIRENPQRMRLLGIPVFRYLFAAFVASGFAAGVAGAISAQTNKIVGLRVLSIEASVDGLLMLVLGGVARLYGALIGAPLYGFVQHQAAKWNPYHWMFVIGTLLMLVVLFARGGFLGICESILSRIALGRKAKR